MGIVVHYGPDVELPTGKDQEVSGRTGYITLEKEALHKSVAGLPLCHISVIGQERREIINSGRTGDMQRDSLPHAS